MATFIVNFRKGRLLLVEGVYLDWVLKEGCDVPLILVQDQGRETVAMLPSDAVSGVYRQDVAKSAGE